MAEPPPPGELGCAGALAVSNMALIGFLTFSLGRLDEAGTINHPAIWAPWLGLFLLGGLIPAIALLAAARRSRRLVIGLTLWMLVALFLTCGAAINSGGGI